MPYPTPHEALEFRWGLPYLLPTLLVIRHEVSRVQHVGLKRDAGGGALLDAPSTLCGFLDGSQGRSGLPVTFPQHLSCG